MKNEIADRARRDKAALVTALERRVELKGNECRCPFHGGPDGERNASAGIYEDNGVWRFKCHSSACGFGGDVWDVIAKLEGKTLAEVLPRSDPFRSDPKPQVFASLEDALAKYPGASARFEYRNPQTKFVELVVIRIDEPGGKTFRQVSPVPGGWSFTAPPKPWPLYNRARIAEAEGVIVVEGEKCVHALHALGFTATSSPCGAGKGEHADWTPLAGKTVWLWPDNDKPGFAHMKQVQHILERLSPAPSVSVIDVESLGLLPKGDAADFVDSLAEMGRDCQIANVQSLLDTANGSGADADVLNLMEDAFSGRKQAIRWPWHHVSDLSNALLPGTITLLHGPPGATKSFFLLESFAHWLERDIKIALYQLEEDRTFHLMRALAQRSGRGEITNFDWLKSNQGKARNIHAEHRQFLSTFGAAMFDAPDKELTRTAALKWIEDQCKAGARVLGIDPITAFASAEKPWSEDQAFVQAAKVILRQYGASLILVTHPTRDRANIAGGAALERFIQTIFRLEFEPQRKAVQIIHAMGSQTVSANRTLKIDKARNGKGTGRTIAFDFSGDALRFVELGVMAIKADKGAREPKA